MRRHLTWLGGLLAVTLLGCAGAMHGAPRRTIGPPPPTWLAEVTHRAWTYFWEESHPKTGLVANTTEPGAPASSTACGFALTAIPIGIERGWIRREEGYQRALTILRTYAAQPHDHGFFYHYVHPATGQRMWQSEWSTIDSAIFIAGALTAAAYFPETEVAQLANALYERMAWDWLLDGQRTLRMSWTPEGKDIPRLNTFSEGILCYLLALGSPTHPIPPESWHAFQRPLGRYAGEELIYTYDGSLFAYVLPLAWFHLRSQHDRYMDYWSNAVAAIRANRAFCQAHQDQFRTYAEGWWGLSASLGPGGYRNYGALPGKVVHDGTIAPYAIAMTVPFLPAEALDTLWRLSRTYQARLWGVYGFTDAFNLDRSWFAKDVLAIDQGLTMVMLDNYMTGLTWRLFNSHPAVQRALAYAGFQPGEQPRPSVLAVRPGNPGAALEIPFRSAPLAVDGALDDWSDATFVELTTQQARNVELDLGYIADDDDASVSWSVAWNPQGLALAGEVRDDQLVRRFHGEEIYRDDCVEVFVDAQGDGFVFDNAPDNFQFGLAPADETTPLAMWAWGPWQRAVDSVRAVTHRTTHGFQFEWVIPWEAMPNQTWSAKRKLRFNLSYHDVDADGIEGKLSWSMDKETHPGTVLLFGSVTLASPPETAHSTPVTP